MMSTSDETGLVTLFHESQFPHVPQTFKVCSTSCLTIYGSPIFHTSNTQDRSCRILQTTRRYNYQRWIIAEGHWTGRREMLTRMYTSKYLHSRTAQNVLYLRFIWRILVIPCVKTFTVLCCSEVMCSILPYSVCVFCIENHCRTKCTVFFMLPYNENNGFVSIVHLLEKLSLTEQSK